MDGTNNETFETPCSWIELCDDKSYTLTELQNKLGKIALGDEEWIYSKKAIKEQARGQVWRSYRFQEAAGKRNVIYFQNMAEREYDSLFLALMVRLALALIIL